MYKSTRRIANELVDYIFKEAVRRAVAKSMIKVLDRSVEVRKTYELLDDLRVCVAFDLAFDKCNYLEQLDFDFVFNPVLSPRLGYFGKLSKSFERLQRALNAYKRELK